MTDEPTQPEPFVKIIGGALTPEDVLLTERVFGHAHKRPPADWHEALYWRQNFPEAFDEALRELGDEDGVA
jgi:hypothetical protein